MSRFPFHLCLLLATLLSSCGQSAQEQDGPPPAPPVSPSTTQPTSDHSDPAENPASRRFLVIYAKGLEEPAQRWKEYRVLQGWNAEAVGLQEAVEASGVDAHGADAVALALRDYLLDEFDKARALGAVGSDFAVLLLGDVPDAQAGDGPWTRIPAFYHPQRDPALIDPRERPDICTDADYQFFDDGPVPDFALGRVPARTAEQAQSVLDKIIAYETRPPNGLWRRRITYVAGEGRFGAVDRLLEMLFTSMVETIVPYDFDVHVTYASPASAYCAPPSKFNSVVRQRFEEGALLVNYIGHGAPTRLDSLRWLDRRYPICDASEARSLTIADGRLPLMFIIACSTGQYDLPAGQECLAESLLFNPAGPIAVISGSRMTHPYANAILQKHLTQQVCQQRRATIGGVDLYGERGLINLDETDTQMELLGSAIALQMRWATSPADLRPMHVLLYNLLGDPATALPYPSLSIPDLTYSDGVVRGRIDGASAGTARITIETPRTRFAHAERMLQVNGETDPEFETKATHNYPLANDRILAQTEVAVGIDGSFAATLAAPASELVRGELRVKVYISTPNGDGSAFLPVSTNPISNGP